MCTYLCVSELAAVAPLLFLYGSLPVLVLSSSVSLAAHPVTCVLAVVWPVVGTLPLMAILAPTPLIDLPSSPLLHSLAMLLVILIPAMVLCARRPGKSALAAFHAFVPGADVFIAGGEGFHAVAVVEAGEPGA